MYHSNIHLSSNLQLCKHDRKGHTPIRDVIRKNLLQPKSNPGHLARGPATIAASGLLSLYVKYII